MLCSQLKVTAFTLELRLRLQTSIATIVNSGDRTFLAIALSETCSQIFAFPTFIMHDYINYTENFTPCIIISRLCKYFRLNYHDIAQMNYVLWQSP